MYICTYAADGFDDVKKYYRNQTAWKSDGYFRKSLFWKKSAEDKNACKITQAK